MGWVASAQINQYIKGDLEMSISLATKYRPQEWEEVVGQETVIKILSRQLETNSIRNCYLFQGATGTGKTTIARIFAKKINSEIDNSRIEIDAASNNGVDNIRAIIEEAQTRSLSGKYKIYIIDECHMLSMAAWNAFLKILEEPPAFTVFILCTTDAHKIPPTIMNRVQVYTFTRLPVKVIIQRLEEVCTKEHLRNYSEGVEYIAKISNGGMRDALTYLDKCVGYSEEISLENVFVTLGNYSHDSFIKLTDNLLNGSQELVLKDIDDYYSDGKDLRLFVDQYLKFCIDVAKLILFNDPAVTKLTADTCEKVRAILNFDNPVNYYNYLMDKLLDLKNMLKNTVDEKSTIEVVFTQIARGI